MLPDNLLDRLHLSLPHAPRTRNATQCRMKTNHQSPLAHHCRYNPASTAWQIGRMIDGGNGKRGTFLSCCQQNFDMISALQANAESRMKRSESQTFERCDQRQPLLPTEYFRDGEDIGSGIPDESNRRSDTRILDATVLPEEEDTGVKTGTGYELARRYAEAVVVEQDAKRVL